MRRINFLGAEAGLAGIGVGLCLWALWAQQHYRVVIGTSERAIAWVGVALAALCATLIVRDWIENWLAGRDEALRAIDSVANMTLWFLRLYVIWSVVLLANAQFDRSPASYRKAVLEQAFSTEIYFAYFMPLSWGELQFADGTPERLRVLFTPLEAPKLWGGQPVEVEFRKGALGLTRIVSVRADAEASNRAVLKIAPTATAAWQGLFEYYAARDFWPEAIDTAQRYLELSPRKGPVEQVALERFRRGDYFHSLMLARVMFNREKSFITHTYLGWTLAKVGQYDEAVPLLKKAIDLDPQTFWGYYHLAYTYKWARDAANAAAMFREVLKRRPNYPEIEQELRSLGEV
jgi:tetratricopeptide (TPR) repeat protein